MESVKAASEVYAPVDGEVVEVNEAIVANPELVNQDAEEGNAWFLKIKIGNPRELDALMSAEAYARLSGDSGVMRYLPHDGSDARRQMLADIGVAHVDGLFEAVPPEFLVKAIEGLPGHQSEMAVERAWRELAGRNIAGRIGAVLRRLRRLQAPCAGQRRSHHPALRIHDGLYALSAGDRARHAAISVRVPDPGRGADRHGCRQRLDV